MLTLQRLGRATLQRSGLVRAFYTVMSFGDGSQGAPGQEQIAGSVSGDAYEPAPVEALPHNVAAGHYHTLALTSDDHVWSWGRNNEGQLGRGTALSREQCSLPQMVKGLEGVKVKDITGSGVISMAIDVHGSLWAWGKSRRGQLGLGEGITQVVFPQLVQALYGQQILQEMHENMAVVRFCRVLHNSSKCLAEKNETEVKPDDKTNGSSPGPPPEAKSIRGSPVSWLSLGLLLVTGAGLVYYYNQEKKRLIKDFKEEAKPGPGVGKAAIGGPFNLINHEGNEVTEQDFKGNWTLVYFGFTHCPDICPDELQKMAEAVDVIEKKDGIRITPVFISVDPERDNVEQVREYVKEFHPRLIGLTGTPDNIKQVAREFRVYYMKTEEEGSDYLVDHSIIMYLMDPQMDFIKFFGKNYDVKGLADGIVEEIKQYRQ